MSVVVSPYMSRLIDWRNEKNTENQSSIFSIVVTEVALAALSASCLAEALFHFVSILAFGKNAAERTTDSVAMACFGGWSLVTNLFSEEL
jgi:hypothetical protein